MPERIRGSGEGESGVAKKEEEEEEEEEEGDISMRMFVITDLEQSGKPTNGNNKTGKKL